MTPRVMPFWFHRDLVAWALAPRGHGDRPSCPGRHGKARCNGKVEKFVSTVGEPLEIVFTCGHTYYTSTPGIDSTPKRKEW